MIAMIEPQPQNYWQAVQTRDAAFDGVFFYAVRSTRIFCRPSCPSRRPKFENVAFFEEVGEAMQAGYRPCLRCKPLGQNLDSVLVQQATKVLESDLESSQTLKAWAEAVGVKTAVLEGAFKKVLGIGPKQYREAWRQERFKTGLKNGESVTRALYEAGYGSASRVYETPKLGMTPAKYQKGGVGETIGYCIVHTSFDWLLVAATEKGLCAVRLGDTEQELLDTLRSEFPSARLSLDAGHLKDYLVSILAYLDGQPLSMELPLDVQATAFQLQVWEALRRIPYGQTRSYSQVADALGKPEAVRAVARACATNPVGLVVPCHRVIGKGGKLSGYRWGLSRKQKLLQMEAVSDFRKMEAVSDFRQMEAVSDFRQMEAGHQISEMEAGHQISEMEAGHQVLSGQS
jgi:AraC family transcriptional regulator of adaptative response/methylated-DNA-[protein]-cysteine methyltransferase